MDGKNMNIIISITKQNYVHLNRIVRRAEHVPIITNNRKNGIL